MNAIQTFELIETILQATPLDVLQVMDTITDAGFEAYLVGGCVRDVLLDLTPKDYDITTNAPITELKKIFPNMKMHGKAFGVVIVDTGVRTVDVAHYRKDIGTGNHRHPQEVDLDCSVDDDILRRDFTVNAIAVNRSSAVMATTSLEDVKNDTLRLVGDPFKRLEEDALRIMRAYRFSATKGLIIYPETRNAIRVKRELLKHVSSERIREEFFKILLSPGYALRTCLDQMIDDHIFDIILPEFVPCINSVQNPKYHMHSVANHIIQATVVTPAVLELRVAAFFHDIGKPLAYFVGDDDQPHHYGKAEYDQLNHEMESSRIARKVLRWWGCSNLFIGDVCSLIENHMAPFWENPTKKRFKKLLNTMGVQRFRWLIELRCADRIGSGTRGAMIPNQRKKECRELLHQILKEKEAFTRADLALNGNDIHELLGVCGKAIGDWLQALMDYVIEEPDRNNREDLIQFLGRH